MKLNKIFLLLGLMLCIVARIGAQPVSPLDLAADFAYSGMDWVEKGDDKEAIRNFRIAMKLNPANPQYTHLLCQVLFRQERYEEVMTEIFPLIQAGTANAKSFQLYGNSLDMLGFTDRAILVYQEGLKKFEHPGPLYMELGVVEYSRENDELALQYWEEGVEKDPTSAGCYFWLAKIRQDQEEWLEALTYGEIFVNLERASDRTREISRLLWEVSQTVFAPQVDSLIRPDFTSEDSLEKPQKGRPGFTETVEAALVCPADPKDSVSVELLTYVRSHFLDRWSGKSAKRFRVPLYDYLLLVRAQGHLEAYQYWLYFDGVPLAFRAWYAENRDAYEAFEDWFVRNPMPREAKKAFSPRLFSR